MNQIFGPLVGIAFNRMNGQRSRKLPKMGESAQADQMVGQVGQFDQN